MSPRYSRFKRTSFTTHQHVLAAMPTSPHLEYRRTLRGYRTPVRHPRMGARYIQHADDRLHSTTPTGGAIPPVTTVYWEIGKQFRDLK